MSVSERKIKSLIEEGFEEIGVILQKDGKRVTVDKFGRVQWWELDGSGEMAPNHTDFLSVDGLPPELVSQLSLSAAEIEKQRIVEIVRKIGLASVNHILIGIYRVHGLCLKRAHVLAVMHKLNKDGRVVGVNKGRYSLP